MLPPFAAYELPYPKICHVYLTADQAITANTETVIAPVASLWDTYGMFTGGSNQYITIPEDGLYLINARLKTTVAITATLLIRVSRNGVSDQETIIPPQSNAVTIIMMTYINMFSKGDKLDLRAYYYGSTSITIRYYIFNSYLEVLKMPYVTKGF